MEYLDNMLVMCPILYSFGYQTIPFRQLACDRVYSVPVAAPAGTQRDSLLAIEVCTQSFTVSSKTVSGAQVSSDSNSSIGPRARARHVIYFVQEAG